MTDAAVRQSLYSCIAPPVDAGVSLVSAVLPGAPFVPADAVAVVCAGADVAGAALDGAGRCTATSTTAAGAPGVRNTRCPDRASAATAMCKVIDTLLAGGTVYVQEFPTQRTMAAYRAGSRRAASAGTEA